MRLAQYFEHAYDPKTSDRLNQFVERHLKELENKNRLSSGQFSQWYRSLTKSHR